MIRISKRRTTYVLLLTVTIWNIAVYFYQTNNVQIILSSFLLALVLCVNTRNLADSYFPIYFGEEKENDTIGRGVRDFIFLILGGILLGFIIWVGLRLLNAI